MTRKKDNDEGTVPSLYGNGEPRIGDFMEYSSQYECARKALLDAKGIVDPESLALTSDAGVDNLLQRHFCLVGQMEGRLLLVDRRDVENLRKLLVEIRR